MVNKKVGNSSWFTPVSLEKREETKTLKKEIRELPRGVVKRTREHFETLSSLNKGKETPLHIRKKIKVITDSPLSEPKGQTKKEILSNHIKDLQSLSHDHFSVEIDKILEQEPNFLHQLIVHNSTEGIGLVKRTLSQKSELLNVCDKEEKSLFLLAVQENNIPLVKWLLEKGADISEHNKQKQTCLDIAQKAGHHEMENEVKEILTKELFQVLNGQKITINLSLDALMGTFPFLDKELLNILSSLADVMDDEDEQKEKELEAIRDLLFLLIGRANPSENSDGELFKEIFRLKPDIGDLLNSKDKKRGTLLHYATENQQQELVNFLLHLGADPLRSNSKNQDGLAIAEAIGNQEIIKAIKASITLKVISLEDAKSSFNKAKIDNLKEDFPWLEKTIPLKRQELAQIKLQQTAKSRGPLQQRNFKKIVISPTIKAITIDDSKKIEEFVDHYLHPYISGFHDPKEETNHIGLSQELQQAIPSYPQLSLTLKKGIQEKAFGRFLYQATMGYYGYLGRVKFNKEAPLRNIGARGNFTPLYIDNFNPGSAEYKNLLKEVSKALIIEFPNFADLSPQQLSSHLSATLEAVNRDRLSAMPQ